MRSGSAGLVGVWWIALVGILAGCAGAPQGGAVGVAVSAPGGRLAESLPATQPASAPALGFDPAGCAQCHAAAYEEWSESQHAAAYVNGIFQSEFVQSRPAWCVGCHAPSVPDFAKVNDADPLATQGVGCMACHLQAGELVSTKRAANSPHQTRPDPAFGGTQFCAQCHQFNFPVLDDKGFLLRYTKHPMQETIAQYQASNYAGVMSCLDCHGDTPGKHRLPGSHHLETLQSALRLHLCRSGGTLRAGVENRDTGHHVPSGGVHRFVVLRAWRSEDPARLYEGYIGRRFRPIPGEGKETISDTTIPPDETRWFTLSPSALGPGDGPINVELRYVYGLNEHADIPGETLSQAIYTERTTFRALPICR